MNITRSQSIVLTIISLGLFFGIGFFFSLRQKTGIVQSAREVSLALNSENGQGASILLSEFHRSETRDGVKLWEVRGEKGEYFPGQNTARITKPDLWFFRREGDVVHLTAKNGTVHVDGSTLVMADLEGDVQVKVENRGVTIDTERAVYRKDTETVHAPGPVQMRSEMLDLSGTSLVANITTQEFVLEHEVRSIIRKQIKK